MSEVEHDTKVRVNWATLNVSSIAGAATLGIAILALNSTYTAKQERQDARIDSIEMELKRSSTIDDDRYQADFIILQSLQQQMPTLVHRVTALESSDVALDARIDRISEALNDLRDKAADIKTSIEVLTEQIRQGFRDQQPPEVRTRTRTK